MAMEMYSKADRDRRYDHLTGLYSRLSLNEFLEKDEKEQPREIGAAIMLDLDNFKDINVRYGNAAGDRCLRALGSLLLNFGVSRKIDFYRYGGDEFVGLVRDPGTDLSKLSSDLLSEIRTVCVKYGNVEIPLTACIGITSDGKDRQAMINNADKAMYLAKHHGKNQGCTV
ncbi:MAG: GGDEF domain-containing protein [Bilifractor sp.]|nr:GGDEF domain-containing protein [Bilifractor sp.]